MYSAQKKEFYGYECALNFNDRHFLQNPIQLDCPHYVCKNCIKTESIACAFCGILTDKSLKNRGLANIKKQDILNNFGELFNETEKRYRDNLKRFLDSKG